MVFKRLIACFATRHQRRYPKLDPDHLSAHRLNDVGLSDGVDRSRLRD